MNGYFYLATPYTKYPLGIQAAFEDACMVAAWFMDEGLPVFCPIAHTHPIAAYSTHNALDSDFWVKLDHPLLAGAKRGLIIVKMRGWGESSGIKAEKEFFEKAGWPIHYVEPNVAAIRDFANGQRLAPRDPDQSRQPPFVYHNCWRCDNGAKPCVDQNPGSCQYLHARND